VFGLPAALTCTNAGSEKVLVAWYGSGPSYNARVIDPVAMTAGTLLDMDAKYPLSAFTATYYNLACIEVDTTSGNYARCLLATSGGVVYELQTESTNVFILGVLTSSSGSGNYAAICVIDSARKKFVQCCGTSVTSMARAEYDNTSSYIGCVRSTATAGNSCAVTEKGNLDIFSGLTTRTKYYFQPNSYTLTAIQKGPIALEATDTTKANIIASTSARFSNAVTYRKTVLTGGGKGIIYHNLGVMPKSIKLYAAGNPNTGSSSLKTKLFCLEKMP